MRTLSAARLRLIGCHAGLRDRRFAILAAMIVLGTSLWALSDALSAGWWLDDYNQRGVYWGAVWPKLGPWDMHRGIHAGEAAAWRDAGVLPWWTHDDFSFSPLRPLTSLLLYWNFTSFGVDATPYHAVTLLLWIAMSAAVAALYRQLMTEPQALLALLLFVLSRAHAGTVAWVASRGLLLSALFGFITLCAYVRWREHASAWAYPLHVVAFTLCLGGGEYALCIPGYLMGYELVRSSDRPLRRVQCLASAAVLSVGYLGWHIAGGYGVNHGRWYANPLSAPGAFARMLGHSLPSYLAEGLLGLPVPLGGEGYEGWACAALLVSTAGLTRFTPADGHARWLFAGGLLSCLPCALTLFQPRLVVFPKLGFAAVLSVGIVEVWRALPTLARQGRWLPPSVAAVLLVVHVPVAAWLSRRETHARVLEQGAHRDAAEQVDLGPAGHTPESVFLIHASVVPVALTAPMARHMAGAPLIKWHVLSPALGPQSLRRLSATRFELTTLSAGIFANPDALAFRSPRARLRVGDEIRNGPLRVRVMEVADSGPTRMAFELDWDLDSKRYRFLTSTPCGYQPFVMPAIGRSSMIGPAFNVDWLCRERPVGRERPCI